jgi:hypothetical protein
VNASGKRQEAGNTHLAIDQGLALRALDDALRNALASAPREEVMRRVAAAVTMDVAEGESPGDVEAAIKEQVRLGHLDELLQDFEAEYGPVDEELVDRAMREWPDYEAG